MLLRFPERRAIVLGLLVLASCSTRGEELGKVRGQVSCDGQPVAEGLLIFSNAAKGVHIVAPLRADGSYEVEMAEGHGLPLGVYQVYVSPPLPDLPAVGPIASKPLAKEYANIPKRYRDPKTSGLTVTVPRGGTVFDVPMKTARDRPDGPG